MTTISPTAAGAGTAPDTARIPRIALAVTPVLLAVGYILALAGIVHGIAPIAESMHADQYPLLNAPSSLWLPVLSPATAAALLTAAGYIHGRMLLRSRQEPFKRWTMGLGLAGITGILASGIAYELLFPGYGWDYSAVTEATLPAANTARQGLYAAMQAALPVALLAPASYILAAAAALTRPRPANLGGAPS